MRDFKLRRRFNKLVKDGGAGGGAGGGTGSGVMRVGINFGRDAITLGKTWQEIADCFANGGYAYIAGDSEPGVTSIVAISGITHEGSTYGIIVGSGTQSSEFACSSPNEYPTQA